MFNIRVDDNDKYLLDKYNWYLNNGYARARIDGKNKYLHRIIMDEPKSNVDHVNGNKLDNRRCNLRLCNQSQNMANQGLSRANKTGYKGVFYRTYKKKFTAYITVKRKRTYLGYFTDVKKAAEAYNESAMKHFGEFAVLN